MRTLKGTEQQSMHLGPASCKLGCNLAGLTQNHLPAFSHPTPVSKLHQLTSIANYQGFKGQTPHQISFKFPPFSAK